MVADPLAEPLHGGFVSLWPGFFVPHPLKRRHERNGARQIESSKDGQVCQRMLSDGEYEQSVPVSIECSRSSPSAGCAARMAAMLRRILLPTRHRRAAPVSLTRLGGLMSRADFA